MRQQTNPDITAVHPRSLAAGPPTALLMAIRRLVPEAEAFAARRRSSAPPDLASDVDSEPPGRLDEGDSDPLGMEIGLAAAART